MSEDKFANFPAFFTTTQFADMMGCAYGHISRAAQAYVDGRANHRARLPEGWAAIRWNARLIVFQVDDAEAIERLFGEKVTIR